MSSICPIPMLSIRFCGFSSPTPFPIFLSLAFSYGETALSLFLFHLFVHFSFFEHKWEHGWPAPGTASSFISNSLITSMASQHPLPNAKDKGADRLSLTREGIGYSQSAMAKDAGNLMWACCFGDGRCQEVRSGTKVRKEILPCLSPLSLLYHFSLPLSFSFHSFILSFLSFFLSVVLERNPEPCSW